MSTLCCWLAVIFRLVIIKSVHGSTCCQTIGSVHVSCLLCALITQDDYKSLSVLHFCHILWQKWFKPVSARTPAAKTCQPCFVLIFLKPEYQNSVVCLCKVVLFVCVKTTSHHTFWIKLKLQLKEIERTMLNEQLLGLSSNIPVVNKCIMYQKVYHFSWIILFDNTVLVNFNISTSLWLLTSRIALKHT